MTDWGGFCNDPRTRTNGELSITCILTPGSSVDKEKLKGARKAPVYLVPINLESDSIVPFILKG